MADFGGGEGGRSPIQTVDKKLFAPEGGRIALSANERIAEFLDFAIQAKFAYVNKGLSQNDQTRSQEAAPLAFF